MKKIIPLVLISFIICTSFNKRMILVIDYRDAYVGSYFCKSYCQTLNEDHSVINTNISTQTIIVTKDPLDSILKINIGSTSYKVKLNNDLMSAFPSRAHFGGRFYQTDSIGFVISVSNIPNACRYSGKKN